MEKPITIQRQIVTRIRTLRKERGLSQEQLANACNVSKSMISKLETDRATVNLDLLITIAFALDVSMSDLLDVPIKQRKQAVVIRECDRQRLAAGVPGKQGYNYYRLADHPDKLDAMWLDIHKEACTFNRFVSHAGHEFLSVVEGEISLSFRDETFILKKGDTAFFDGGIDHKIIPNKCDFAQLITLFIHI